MAGGPPQPHYELMRTPFVERVSNVLIYQLLDHLLDDVVLNDREKNAVLQGENEAVRAGLLFDMVRQKGAIAMNRMNVHLQHRDPKLYQILQNWFQIHYELMRTQFVAKVSNEVIDQLLNHLLANGILNDGERDSVLEENSTSDKARRLFNMVKRKGYGAMKRMVFHLQHRDPVLYQSLLNWAQQHYGLMRTQVGEKITDELIKYILDELLFNRFLNDEERDSVLQGDNEADRAHHLFDMLNRKPYEAMKKMVVHFQHRDLAFYQSLLNWAQEN